MSEHLSSLSRVIDPELRQDIVSLGMVGDIHEDEVSISIDLKLTIVGCPAAQKIERDVIDAIKSDKKVSVNLGVMNQAERDALKEKLRGGRPVRTNPFDEDSYTRVYLVGSGKGGVGKSSITANLAVSLAKRGHKVGLIDADIFGFSIPRQLGVTDKPTKVDELMLPPIVDAGIASEKSGVVKVISIGMFLDGNQAVAWRGPMLHRAIQQFLTDVHWGDLDFLLVDLPPGTGDVAISLGQLLPTAKSIVVTTPQLAAAEVAQRSAAVGLQTGQGILGVIENMSWLEQDGKRVELFGAGGGLQVAEALAALAGQSVPLLGQVPMSIKLREGSDAGVPVVVSHPTDSAALAIELVVDQVVADKLVRKNKSLRLNT